MTSKNIEDFFNFNFKCPEEIKNCSDLRKEYKNKLDFLTKINSCKGCSINQLKAYFIDRIRYGII